MNIDNVLRYSANRRLCEYVLPRGPDDELLGSPWDWPGLSIATDSGPDCVPAPAPPRPSRIASALKRAALMRTTGE
eukprot:3775890-Pyramimonas_sp.AAC.1